MSTLEARIAEVLAGHQKESTGMTFGSPDRCYCGQEVHTPKGDADVMDRKIGAFAAHQAAMLAPVIAEAKAEALEWYVEAVERVDEVIAGNEVRDGGWLDYLDSESEFRGYKPDVPKSEMTSAVYYAKYRAQQLRSNDE